MQETWKPVPGYEGLYEVSDQGRVRSLDRVVPNGSPGGRLIQGQPLKTAPAWGGYRRVCLPKNKSFLVHCLVAAAFLGPRPDKHDVRHLNGNRTDNRLANLAYGDRAENLRDCYRYGSHAPQGRLTRDQIFEIRDLLASGRGVCEIAKQFKVHRDTISRIKSGATFEWLQKEVV